MHTGHGLKTRRMSQGRACVCKGSASMRLKSRRTRHLGLAHSRDFKRETESLFAVTKDQAKLITTIPSRTLFTNSEMTSAVCICEETKYKALLSSSVLTTGASKQQGKFFTNLLWNLCQTNGSQTLLQNDVRMGLRKFQENEHAKVGFPCSN